MVVNTLTDQFVPPESLEEQWGVTGLAGEQSLCAFEKYILLRVLNDKWKEHLSSTGHLRQGIHLRGYAGRNTSGKRLSCSLRCWLRSSTKLSVLFPDALCRELDEELGIQPLS